MELLLSSKLIHLIWRYHTISQGHKDKKWGKGGREGGRKNLQDEKQKSFHKDQRHKNLD